jgi:hypothetical protein
MNIWEIKNRTQELIRLYKKIQEEEPDNKIAQELISSSLPVLENLHKLIQKKIL